jgi:hypothetical protein
MDYRGWISPGQTINSGLSHEKILGLRSPTAPAGAAAAALAMLDGGLLDMQAISDQSP